MNLFFVLGSGGSARLVTPDSAVPCYRGSLGIRCCGWPPTPASPSRSARSTSTNGARVPLRATSPRCSPAVRPLSSRRSHM